MFGAVSFGSLPLGSGDESSSAAGRAADRQVPAPSAAARVLAGPGMTRREV